MIDPRRGLDRCVRLLLVLACAMPLTASVAGARDSAGPEPATGARQLRSELVALADAWAEGGGTFGYPFWDKAAQRYGAREISPSLFREYVSGYRDRLSAGCQLLEAIDGSDGVASDVDELVREACARRVEGLRAQQQLLGVLIASTAASSPSPADSEALDARIAELEAEANDAFQDAWRSTRTAMDVAQAALVEGGADPLPEDAFI